MNWTPRSIRLNGTRSVSGGANSLTACVTPVLGPVVGGGSYQGNMYETALLIGDYTDLQIQQMEGYLAWKWGLQANLPPSHPYYLVNPAATTTNTGPGNSISTAISTVTQFTSNTSNFYNPFVNYDASTALVSTVIGSGNIYMSTFSGSSFGLSTGALVTSSIYGRVISSLLTYTSTLLLTADPDSYWMVDVNGFSRSAV